jgi:hypothetical protein
VGRRVAVIHFVGGVRNRKSSLRNGDLAAGLCETCVARAEDPSFKSLVTVPSGQLIAVSGGPGESTILQECLPCFRRKTTGEFIDAPLIRFEYGVSRFERMIRHSGTCSKVEATKSPEEVGAPTPTLSVRSPFEQSSSRACWKSSLFSCMPRSCGKIQGACLEAQGNEIVEAESIALAVASHLPVWLKPRHFAQGWIREKLEIAKHTLIEFRTLRSLIPERH